MGASSITGINCEQDFTTWLCRVDSQIPANERLMKKISYTIKGKFSVSPTNQVSGFSTSVSIGSAETPLIGAALPNVNTHTMNNNEQWFNGVNQV